MGGREFRVAPNEVDSCVEVSSARCMLKADIGRDVFLNDDWSTAILEGRSNVMIDPQSDDRVESSE